MVAIQNRTCYLTEFIFIMDYKIGTRVYIEGSLLGAIAYLIVAPHFHQITHLIVEQSVPSTLKIIPLELIDIQTKRAIVLTPDTMRNDLLDFNADFYESINGNLHILMPKSYLHPLYYYPQIDIGDIDSMSTDGIDNKLNIGMSVYDSNAQKCGFIVEWNEDETGQFVSLVIRIPHDERDVTIPTSWISHTKVQEVYLDIERSTLIS